MTVLGPLFAAMPPGGASGGPAPASWAPPLHWTPARAGGHPAHAFGAEGGAWEWGHKGDAEGVRHGGWGGSGVEWGNRGHGYRRDPRAGSDPRGWNGAETGGVRERDWSSSPWGQPSWPDGEGALASEREAPLRFGGAYPAYPGKEGHPAGTTPLWRQGGGQGGWGGVGAASAPHAGVPGEWGSGGTGVPRGWGGWAGSDRAPGKGAAGPAHRRGTDVCGGEGSVHSEGVRLVVLAGLPGAGKSTLAQRFAARGWAVVNQDTLGNRKRCEEEARAALFRGARLQALNHTPEILNPKP